MTDGDSVTIDNLRDSANGTFVTLDDDLLLTLLEKKEVKRNRKNQVDITIRRVFGSKMLKKHEIGDEKGDKKKGKKEKTQNNLNQVENGTGKTCVQKKKKQEEKRKTQREQSEKRKKETNN